MNAPLQTIVEASIEQFYEQYKHRTANRFVRSTNQTLKMLIVLALDWRGLQTSIEEQPTRDRRSQDERKEIFNALTDKLMDTILEILPEDVREEYYSMICNSYEDID